MKNLNLIIRIIYYDFVRLRYKFSYTVADHEDWMIADDGVESPKQEYRYTGLHPATLYDLKVSMTAIDDPMFAPRAVVTTGKTKVGVPSKPRNLKVRQDGIEAIVTWSPPERPNGIMRSYELNVLMEQPGGEWLQIEQQEVQRKRLRQSMLSNTG